MDQPQQDQDAASFEEPRQHTHLRWLVMALTATMIIGLVVIIAMIVTLFLREPEPKSAPVDDALKIQVPDGETVITVTKGADWNAIVTRDADGKDRLHLFDVTTGEIYRSIVIDE